MPFGSDPAFQLPDDANARIRRGNTLLALGRAAEAVVAYREALALRPDHAGTLYNLGNAHLARDDAAEAVRCYDAALALAPDHAGCLNNRGGALRHLGRLAEAADSFRAALALRPDLAGAHDNFGAVLLALRRPEAAEPALREALRLDPAHAGACNNLGGALLALDRPREALAWFRRATDRDPALAQARLGAALALLALGELREGFTAYQARWLDPKLSEGARADPAPLWDGTTELRGRTILLQHEQGLGDTIQFARYAPLLRARGARIVLEVQPPLVRLLAPLADAVVEAGAEPPPHDCRLPLLDVPRALGTDLATIPAAVPYLAAPPATSLRGPGLNVALTLRGSPDHPEDALRSIPPPLVAPLLATPGVTFHLVHVPPAEADTALPAIRHGPALRDFADTAALLAAMDLVVTVDTALAHLAGALAVPVWLLLQHAADWRWLQHREDSPWYPTARLFRQGPDRRWQPVLARVAAALAATPVSSHLENRHART